MPALHHAVILLYGLCLWTPALAPLMSYGLPLQIIDLCLPLVACVIWPALRNLRPSALLLVVALWLSTALNPSPTGHGPLLWYWQLSLPILHIGAIATIAATPQHRPLWVKGFITGGTLSLLLAFVQIGSEGAIGDFRNNIVFALPDQAQRGVALMPEVSTLSAAVCLYIGLLLMSKSLSAKGTLLQLTLAALYLAQSGSKAAILFLPLVILSSLWAHHIPRRTKIMALCLVGVVSLSAALTSLTTRNATGAAERSAQMRAATILASLDPIATGELIGHGIGAQSEITAEALRIARSHGLRFGQLPKGVNSFVTSSIYEQGILFAVLTMITACALWYNGCHTPPRDSILSWFGLWCWMASLMIIGYRGIYLNWLPYGLWAAILSSPTHPIRLPWATRDAFTRP